MEFSLVPFDRMLKGFLYMCIFLHMQVKFSTWPSPPVCKAFVQWRTAAHIAHSLSPQQPPVVLVLSIDLGVPFHSLPCTSVAGGRGDTTDPQRLRIRSAAGWEELAGALHGGRQGFRMGSIVAHQRTHAQGGRPVGAFPQTSCPVNEPICCPPGTVAHMGVQRATATRDRCACGKSCARDVGQHLRR